jgi:hypothetical protein
MGCRRTPRKRTKSADGTAASESPDEGSTKKEPSEPARSKDAPDLALQRFLGRGIENVTRTFLATRAGLKPDTPWPELLEALDRFDPELSRMLRRVADAPSKPRPPPKE